MGYTSNIDKADRTAESTEFPDVVLIDNCNACNLRCSMCDHKNIKQYRPIQNMEMALYKKLIDEIAEENPAARVWEIFFGDPFMCRDMTDRVRYAKQKGLTDVVLNTNGVLMTRKKSEEMIRTGLDAMYVGIDAATAETYQKIRVGGNFDKAVQNVLIYRDILEREGRTAQKLFVQFVVSETNEDEVDDFKKFWRKAGVNIKIRPKVSWAGLVNAKNLRVNNEVLRKPCYWLMRTINICADGEVALCSVDVHCRVKAGNVQMKRIKEIWQGTLQKYRKMHMEGKFGELPEMCRKCSDWQSAYADFVHPETSETC